jgi:Putative transmembrane protein (PGPGW)
MTERIRQYTLTRPRLKKAIGYFFVVIGFIALVTPLTPGAFLLVIGLELLGMRLAFFDRFMPKKQSKTEELPQIANPTV